MPNLSDQGGWNTGTRSRDTGPAKCLPRPRTWLAALATGCSLWVIAGVDDNLMPDARSLALANARFGAAAAGRLSEWREVVSRCTSIPEAEKLRRINRFINRIPSMDDQTLWGQRDYWATPVEFLVRNGGDCEDYALAKYFSLKAAGVPTDKLRITYARAWLPGQGRMEAHMVLAYYTDPDAEPLILDNLTNDILPASRRSDLSPTMSFNAEGLWTAKQQGQHGRLGDTSSIHHWNDLLARMGRERRGEP